MNIYPSTRNIDTNELIYSVFQLVRHQRLKGTFFFRFLAKIIQKATHVCRLWRNMTKWRKEKSILVSRGCSRKTLARHIESCHAGTRENEKVNIDKTRNNLTTSQRITLPRLANYNSIVIKMAQKVSSILLMIKIVIFRFAKLF